MKTIQPLEVLPFVPSGSFNAKYAKLPFTAVHIDLQGQVDISTSPLPALAGAHSLISSIELRQGSDTLVSMKGPELAFLAAINEADAQALNPNGASSADQPFKATATLDFAALGPLGTVVDAGLGANELYIEGNFGPYTAGNSKWGAPTTASAAGKLRTSVSTIARTPTGGPRHRPAIVAKTLDIGSGAGTDIPFTFTADGPFGGVLMGFLVRAYDFSQKANGLTTASSDTLIRHVRVEANTVRYAGTYARMSWGEAKRRGAQWAGIKRNSSGILPTGVTMIPIIDEQGDPANRGGLVMQQGDKIELIFDTLSDVTAEFGAAAGTTPATGDQVVITPLYFRRINAANDIVSVPAGSGANVVAGKKRVIRRR